MSEPSNTDITTQKDAEEEFGAGEGFMASIVDAIRDGISVLDRDMTIVSTNRTMKNLYASMRPLEGKKCYQAYHGRTDPCEICPTIRAFETCKAEKDEVPLIEAGTEKGVLELSAFPILDGKGNATGVIEYVRDITETKAYEKKLSDAATEWQVTFDATNSVIWLLDKDCRILRSNKITESVFHRPEHKIVGRHCWEIVHGTREPLPECPLSRAAETLKRETEEIRIKDHWYEITVDPIVTAQGSFEKAVHILTDITERKALESEREELIGKLQTALDEIKTLEGIVPICSNCNKIRDDQGYWNRLEAYIEKHSAASFSHGLCPDCSDRMYGDEDWYIEMKKNKGRD